MFRLVLAALGVALAAAQELATPDGTRRQVGGPQDADAHLGLRYQTEYAPSYRPTTYRPTEVATPAGRGLSAADAYRPTVKPTAEANDGYRPTAKPTDRPRESGGDHTYQPTRGTNDQVSYRPGDLTVRQLGLKLSTGLSAKVIARSGESPIPGVPLFHELPDGGACFPDPRKKNKGGWAYVSNSEITPGGVGSIVFDSSGEIIDYFMLLTGTRRNCGGGKSPWGTWLSAEEAAPYGRIWEVDPFGKRFKARRVELVSQGGDYESVAYDNRDGRPLAFYTTEDAKRGPLTRFTPDDQSPGPHGKSKGIRGSGSYEYLVLENDGNGGDFWFASEREDANAEDAYPFAEGIDIRDGMLYFVSKRRKMLFILDLDEGTYEASSTESGAFDEQPDQVARIVGDDILYFCEDGGPGKGGVHARDGRTGRFFTIMDGGAYKTESTGLAFSPDKLHMYVSFQSFGIFSITRDDGRPFDGATLDIKYHAD